MINQNADDEHRYDDIINLPHHVSETRPPMSQHDRAAQFSPFAALTGFGAAINETARLTDDRIELDESSKDAIADRLQLLQERIEDHPTVAITYFKPDEKKAGGSCVTVKGCVKKIDDYARMMMMTDGTKIPIEDIIAVEGDVFRLL